MSTLEPNQPQPSHENSEESIAKKLDAVWKWLSQGLRPTDKDEGVIQADSVKLSVHVFIGLLALLCLLFILWACIGQLDVASIAKGEIFPSTKLKVVQHLEGGIVKAIEVKEGEKVTRGQPLVILESTASGSDVQQLAVNIASLRVNEARLAAEIEDAEQPVFSSELQNQFPDLVKESTKFFKIRKQRLQSELTSYQEQVQQSEAERDEINGRMKKLKEELKLVLEQVKISEDLLKEDLTNRYNHIELLRSAKSLESKIAEDEASLQRINAAVNEKKSNLAKAQQNFKEEASQKLEETRRQLDEFTQRMEKYKDSLRRTVIESPVDGVVKRLYVFTKGGVVKPGDAVLDIIPSGDKLIVDARLPVQDVGYVQVGQPVTIRLASVEARRFDNLPGKVIFVSPDTITPDAKEGNIEPYYLVRIETDRDYFKRGELHYRLYPGMQVTASIITGHRSVMSYLLDPFFGWFSEALQER